ncbi:MAG: hypothetical protein GY948_13810 [Alphaproteobacteria bacterium]|nr:hypothetical protein [Alphaproteobacteria bacterium]
MKTVAVVLSTALVAAACMPWEENKLIEQGIGTNVHSPDVPEQTRLLDQYLKFMCVEAGIATLSPEGDPHCNVNGLSPRQLTVLVRAGFNDIDRRCDSYLAWLNSKRRSNAAINNQLNQAGTATAAIMSIAGASRDPISLAAVAFGLAADSFNNFYSRLLLEVEASTVELIVSKNRQEFRKDLNNTLVQFRPDAMHILRSYLLICTPHVIENNINIRSRFSVSGNIAAPQDSFGTDVSRSTLSRSGLVRRAAPVRARQQVTPGRLRPKLVPGLEHQQIDAPSLRRVQLTLCVPESGKYDMRTKQGIRIWETVVLTGPAQPGLVSNSQLDGAEADILKTEPACGQDLRNFQERDIFSNNIERRTLARLKSLFQKKAEKLNQAGGSVQLTLPETVSSIDELRSSIAKLKSAMGIAETSSAKEYLNMEITPSFFKSL